MSDQPSARVEQIGGVETVVLREPATGSEVHVAAGIGSNVYRFATRVGDRVVDVLAAPPDMATLRARPTRWGTGVLFPYPGRIRGGRFTFRGREIVLPVDARDGNAIHGVVRSRPWRVAETAADASGARATTRIDTRTEAIPTEEWPFPFTLSLTTELRGGVLRIEAEVSNNGAEPMPIGLGFHPYFPTPFGPAGTPEDSQVWIEADERWGLGPDSIPTGRVDARGPGAGLQQPTRFGDIPAEIPSGDGPVRNLVFRNGGGGPRGIRSGLAAGIRDAANRVEVNLVGNGDFDTMVFFTPVSPPVVSLEPHTCVPDAFNLDSRPDLSTGTIVVQPGDRWRGWFTISARPLPASPA